MKKKKGRRGLVVLLAILLVIAVVLIVNHEAVRMVFYSNYDPKNKLEVSGEWAGGKTYKNVRYAEISENQYLNLFVPDGDAPAPLMVLVHGGGFIMNDCESRQAELMYQYFRDHGYACATVNYRLAQEEPFPGAVQDVKAAVRFLRANAGEYGYNADNIIIWGESAGGYLSIMAGVTGDDEFNDVPFIGEEQLDEPVSAKVAVVVDYYGVMELQEEAARVAQFREVGIPKFVYTIGNLWLSGALKDYPEYKTCEDFFIRRQFEELSDEERQVYLPESYIRKNLSPENTPYIIISHGDADITVPVVQSYRLYDLLSEQIGLDKVELNVIHNAGHASERMYNDEVLGALKVRLDALLAG